MREHGSIQRFCPPLLEPGELRAFANYVRSFHDADSWMGVVQGYKQLAAAEQLGTSAVWDQIAEEISRVETSLILEDCLHRSEQE